MPRQARQASGTGIYHVMMRGINHQNIFEEQEDYYQFLNTLDLMAQSYVDKNSTLFPLCDTHTVLNRVSFDELNELVNEPLSDEVACLDIEDASKGRPSDDQVMMLIKEKTGVTNSSAFQQLPTDIKKSILVELKSRKASLRQLERLTGIGKSMIYRM